MSGELLWRAGVQLKDVSTGAVHTELNVQLVTDVLYHDV